MTNNGQAVLVEPDLEALETAFREAAEQYAEAVARKKEWADEAKARLELMETAWRDLAGARDRARAGQMDLEDEWGKQTLLPGGEEE